MASVEYAPPDEPLGRLQRGLGSGALWAHQAPLGEVAEAVLACVLEDPTLAQNDSRDGYYAGIAEPPAGPLAFARPPRRPPPAPRRPAAGRAGR